MVNFCTYTCINWIRTLPYVRAWEERYRGDGLVMIGVHTPEFSFEHDHGNIETALEQMNVSWPIAIDDDYEVWRAFSNHYWPALYFIDAQGRIRHHHFGEGEYERSELAIQQLLTEAGASGIEPVFVAPHHRGQRSRPTGTTSGPARRTSGTRRRPASPPLRAWCLTRDRCMRARIRGGKPMGTDR